MFLDVKDMHLEDVGLEGQTILKMEDGIATFQKLKFASTSYNNDVNESFHIRVKNFIWFLKYVFLMKLILNIIQKSYFRE